MAQNTREQNSSLLAEVARLKEAVEARDNFLAVVAHELRNRMTPIVGRVQALHRAAQGPSFDAERMVENLAQIEWSITHYLKGATMLVDVSRIATGKLSLSRMAVDICEVVREVAEYIRPLAQRSSSVLSLDLPDGPVIVSGDRLAIEEILDNLLLNALKYGGGKPILVRVSRDEAEHLATIRVSDEGPGISVEDQARMFERFERAVQRGSHLVGFGLGLWIVRQLCEGMEGSVRLESVQGQGSTFTVALPLHSGNEVK